MTVVDFLNFSIPFMQWNNLSFSSTIQYEITRFKRRLTIIVKQGIYPCLNCRIVNVFYIFNVFILSESQEITEELFNFIIKIALFVLVIKFIFQVITNVARVGHLWITRKLIIYSWMWYYLSCLSQHQQLPTLSSLKHYVKE